MFSTNYSSFTSSCSENICSNNGGAKKTKEKQAETQFITKTEFPPPLNAIFFIF